MIAPLRAVMGDQVSFCGKLGVKAAKLEEVNGVKKDLLARKLFLNIKTIEGPRRSHDRNCS